MTGVVDVVHVIIPAHDEEALLGRLLASVRGAVRHATRDWPRVHVTTTVVLDGCEDTTDAVASRFPDVTRVSAELRCVGAARRDGIAIVRTRHPGPATRTWIACTDADSEVPVNWLDSQLGLAASGVDASVGTVWPHPDELAGDKLHRWLGRHVLREGHPHVHGANLGFRLSAYDAVGGFRALPVGEDVDLVNRMRGAGQRVVATSRNPVLTSARLESRAPSGFAAYLVTL